MDDRAGWRGGWLLAVLAPGIGLAVAVAVPEARSVLIVAANVAAILAIAYVLGRRRPAHMIAWAMVGGHVLLTLTGHTLDLVGTDVVAFPTPRDALLLAAYPFLVCGLVLLTENDPDRSALIDAGIVTIALTALAWIFLVEPRIHDDGLATAVRIAAIAFPLAGMLVFSLVLRLAFTGALRLTGYRLLSGGLIALLFADSAHAFTAATASSGPVAVLARFAWIAAYALVAAAALHPSIRETVPTRVRRNGTHDRLLLLAASSLVIPATMIHLFIRDRQYIVPVLAVGAALMFLLALARVAGLLRDSERKAHELEARRAELEQALTELQDTQDELLHVALHDPLTGLTNRVLLLNRLEHSLLQRDPRLGLLLLDLDGFKTINDTLGHDAGNEVLVTVAERLRSTMRPGDTVARLGGDEFAMIVEGTTPRNITTVAERVRSALREPITLTNGSEVVVTTSIGCALNGTEIEASDLLRNADIAMYAAKRSGRDNWEVFAQDMHEEVLERSRLEADLRKALDRGQLTVHYQPIVDLDSGRLVGAEALLRWKHPTRGLVSPGEFIALAEQTGLIVPIGAWVLREACCQAREWQLAGGTDLKVSVNVSGRQLQSNRILDDVATALEVSGLDPASLVIEITETTLMHDAETEQLEALRALGLRLAVDDFGTGYSSLASLRRYPIDVLKVDRTFVQGIAEGPEGAALTLAIIRIAGSMQLDTIAEGVEDLAQVQELKRMGCFQAQGFHFARPMDATAMRGLVDGIRDGARTLNPA